MPVFAQEKPAAQRYEKELAAFDKQDQAKPPPPKPVLFVGSSTIRRWDLAKSFPELDAMNRGFGGSKIADSVELAPRLVLKYEPRIVVFYAGDNDISAGKSPEQVAGDFERFADLVHKGLPHSKLLFLAIKPSVKRWSLRDKQSKANELIEAFCKQDPRRVFVDISRLSLGDDGKPQADMFIKDGLHLNEKGYAQFDGNTQAVPSLTGEEIEHFP